MKFKIGIFGSSAEELDSNVVEIAKQTGRELANYNVVLITGGSSGIPYIVGYEAENKGVDVWGFTPVTNISEQKKLTPHDDISIYKKIVFVPKNFEFAHNSDVCKKYRNVISTANCDAGIIISGRWGTLNEFTNLFDFGKVIGVLTRTGGVADDLTRLTKKIKKKSNAKIIFDYRPKILVDKLIKELRLKS